MDSPHVEHGSRGQHHGCHTKESTHWQFASTEWALDRPHGGFDCGAYIAIWVLPFGNSLTTMGYLDRMPIGRYGERREVAAAALFLATDESDFVVGAVLNVDGGFHAAGLRFDPEAH